MEVWNIENFTPIYLPELCLLTRIADQGHHTLWGGRKGKQEKLIIKRSRYRLPRTHFRLSRSYTGGGFIKNQKNNIFTRTIIGFKCVYDVNGWFNIK